jgi:hypothetical protein
MGGPEVENSSAAGSRANVAAAARGDSAALWRVELFSESHTTASVETCGTPGKPQVSSRLHIGRAGNRNGTIIVTSGQIIVF